MLIIGNVCLGYSGGDGFIKAAEIFCGKAMFSILSVCLSVPGLGVRM